MGRGRVAARAEIDPFLVMELVAATSAHESQHGAAIHLEVGQPAGGAPRLATEAAIEVLRSGDPLGYTDACGLPALRSRIAREYAHRYGVDIDASRVIVTVGASGACLLGLLAAFAPGERIAVTEPGYPCYRQMLHAFGLEAVALRVDAATGYAPTTAHLDAAGPIDGLLLASPANPTGAVLSEGDWGAIGRWCNEHDVQIVSDEIYHGIVYGEPAHTALSVAPDAIVIGSFSKYFAMTGWRLGWIVIPGHLAEPVDRLSQNLVLAPPTLAQHVGLAAFDATDELDRRVAGYRANRDALAATLHEIGVIDLAPSDGAFYLYGSVEHWGIPALDLSRIWLDELGVAVAPGNDFDPVDGHRFMRWSYATSPDAVGEACRRFRSWASARS